MRSHCDSIILEHLITYMLFLHFYYVYISKSPIHQSKPAAEWITLLRCLHDSLRKNVISARAMHMQMCILQSLQKIRVVELGLLGRVAQWSSYLNRMHF